MSEILQRILTDKDFRKKFVSIVDEDVIEKVYGYVVSQTDEDKNSILLWIEKNKEKIDQSFDTNDKKDIVKDEIKNTSPISSDLKQFSKKTDLILSNPKLKIGSVMEISRSQEAYRSLMEQALSDGWIFRGCTVTSEISDKTKEPIWLVFFY